MLQTEELAILNFDFAKADELRRKGRGYFKAGRPDDALEAFRASLQLNQRELTPEELRWLDRG